METIDDIVREMRDVWAVNYWCEGSKTMNGDYPDVVAITTAELASRIEAAHKYDLKCMGGELKKILHCAKKIREENAKLKTALKTVVDNYYTTSSMLDSIRNAEDVLRGASK